MNGLSYRAVLAALPAMRSEMQPTLRPPHGLAHGLREGLKYAFGFSPIRDVLCLLGLVSLTGTS
jgi:hypothetical protein